MEQEIDENRPGKTNEELIAKHKESRRSVARQLRERFTKITEFPLARPVGLHNSGWRVAGLHRGRLGGTTVDDQEVMMADGTAAFFWLVGNTGQMANYECGSMERMHHERHTRIL